MTFTSFDVLVGLVILAALIVIVLAMNRPADGPRQHARELDMRSLSGQIYDRSA